MEKYITFFLPIKKRNDGKTITKKLFDTLLILSDLCQLHYQTLLTTCLKLLSAKYN